ncbi:MAG TPA: hypothetical protein ENI80_11780 [Acidiferrobacteraceae bacterium]|nr:hypothetical protein [Acidiferrobacteraceae bacterium]
MLSTLVAGLGAALILLFLPLDFLWQGLGLVAVSILCAEELVSIFGRRAVKTLKFDCHGVTVLRNDGSQQRLRPLRATVQTRWVVLRLEQPEGHGVERLLIPFDATSAKGFSRLCASLNQWDWKV